MHQTNIRHADICLDLLEDGSLQISRKSNGTAIVISITEAKFIQQCWELFDWPMAAPTDPEPRRNL